MEKVIDFQALETYYRSVAQWLMDDVLVLSTLGQAVVVALAFLAALLIAPALRAWIERLSKTKWLERGGKQTTRVLVPLALPIAWLIMQWISVLVASQAGWPHQLIQITVSLLTAWVVIRFASQLMRDPTWSKLIAITAWTIAALNIVDLLDDTLVLLDGLALQLGQLRISALTVIKGVLALAVLLWLASVLSGIMERRINQLPNLTPSVQVLFAKLLKIVLVTVAIVAAVSTVGIDLTDRRSSPT
jgi:small-conductance mechanosensitive channel